MSEEVIPPSNLYPQSIPWGRRIENSYREGRSRLEALTGSTLSDNLNTASQLGLMGRQLEEVSARSTYFLEYEDITRTFTVPTSGNVQSTLFRSLSIPLPEDGAPRRPIMFLSGQAAWDAGSSNPAQGSIDVSHNGSYTSLPAPGFGTVAPGFVPSMLRCIVGEPGSTSLSVSVMFSVGQNFGAAYTVTMALEQVRLVVTYGGVEQ